MIIAVRAFRTGVLIAGGLSALLTVQSTLADDRYTNVDTSANAADVRWLARVPNTRAPDTRKTDREAEFERRGQQGGGRIDRNVRRAGHSEPVYTDKRARGFGDSYEENYGPVRGESVSRSNGEKWSPDRKSVSRRPSYFDDLYRRREETRYGMKGDFEPEYGQRLASFHEELPPGREHQYEARPVYEDEGFEGEGPYSDEYYGAGEHYGPGGWEEPYGGYSGDGRSGYYVPPGNWYFWDDFTIFGGVHGFKGPLDRGRNGNFGFHEGLNWGGPLWDYMQIGYQVGGQVVHSNFHGDQVYSNNDDGRTQYFVTAGLFHRAEVCGFQIGVVADWLQDDYYGQINMTQVRSEISYLTKSQNEFGLSAATNTDTANVSSEVLNVTNLPTSLRSADMFSAFWRKRFGQRGEGRLWLGASSNSNVIFGGDIRVPLSKRFAIESSFNYLSADGEQGEQDNTAESWSTVFNLVWYPGWTACRSGKHPYRPLFNVADNTTFMIDPNQDDNGRGLFDNAISE